MGNLGSVDLLDRACDVVDLDGYRRAVTRKLGGDVNVIWVVFDEGVEILNRWRGVFRESEVLASDAFTEFRVGDSLDVSMSNGIPSFGNGMALHIARRRG